MLPRTKPQNAHESQKPFYTLLPSSLTEKIIETLNACFASKKSPSERFSVQARIYSSELLLRISIVEAEGKRQYNFETSLEYQFDPLMEKEQSSTFERVQKDLKNEDTLQDPQEDSNGIWNKVCAMISVAMGVMDGFYDNQKDASSLPLFWSPIMLKDKDTAGTNEDPKDMIYFQYSTENTKLEQMTQKFLQENKNG